MSGQLSVRPSRRPSGQLSGQPRRGVALITALWLVVAIAAVALQFSLDARERRVLGVNAAERGVQRAAAAGALAMVQSRLDYALRTRLVGGNVAANALRSSDPWLDADSLYGGVVMVDSIPVDVRAMDGGAQLNINNVTNQRELIVNSVHPQTLEAVTYRYQDPRQYILTNTFSF